MLPAAVAVNRSKGHGGLHSWIVVQPAIKAAAIPAACCSKHENGLQAGSQSAVRGSKAIALALLNTNAARKSRCRDSPSSLHVKPASRLLQPSRTEQARKASLRAKAAAGVRKHGPVRRKRVPKCGACATCLHPHWKKACIVNQQKATAGTGAAAPGTHCRGKVPLYACVAGLAAPP
eukprot:1144389-Pelagomonas_calceolata.AAC.3